VSTEGEQGQRAPSRRGVAGLALIRDLPRRWAAVLLHPSVRTFDAQRPAARWVAVWLSVAAQAVIEGAGTAMVLLGSGGSEGVSSLPLGPKLHLPHAPLAFGLAAFAGSFAQFFVFAWLLFHSARLVGGRGSFLEQTYLMALFWLPLMAVSTAAELFGVAGSVVGLLLRLYALYLLAPALAAAHKLPLTRAWVALLLVVLAGLTLGLAALAVIGGRLSALVR
jgi:hypothetical protein